MHVYNIFMQLEVQDKLRGRFPNTDVLKCSSHLKVRHISVTVVVRTIYDTQSVALGQQRACCSASPVLSCPVLLLSTRLQEGDSLTISATPHPSRLSYGHRGPGVEDATPLSQSSSG